MSKLSLKRKADSTPEGETFSEPDLAVDTSKPVTELGSDELPPILQEAVETQPVVQEVPKAVEEAPAAKPEPQPVSPTPQAGSPKPDSQALEPVAEGKKKPNWAVIAGGVVAVAGLLGLAFLGRQTPSPAADEMNQSQGGEYAGAANPILRGRIIE